MPKRPIIDDLTARTKAIQDEVNGLVNVMAVTRPETPDQRNLSLLEKYNRKQLPLPRINGTDLNETNDQLEQYLYDPLYAKNHSLTPDSKQPDGISTFDKTIGREGGFRQGVVGTGRFYKDSYVDIMEKETEYLSQDTQDPDEDLALEKMIADATQSLREGVTKPQDDPDLALPEWDSRKTYNPLAYQAEQRKKHILEWQAELRKEWAEEVGGDQYLEQHLYNAGLPIDFGKPKPEGYVPTEGERIAEFLRPSADIIARIVTSGISSTDEEKNAAMTDTVSFENWLVNLEAQRIEAAMLEQFLIEPTRSELDFGGFSPGIRGILDQTRHPNLEGISFSQMPIIQAAKVSIGELDSAAVDEAWQSAMANPDAMDEIGNLLLREPKEFPSTNIIGQTIGKHIGPVASGVGRGVGEIGKAHLDMATAGIEWAQPGLDMGGSAVMRVRALLPNGLITETAFDKAFKEVWARNQKEDPVSNPFERFFSFEHDALAAARAFRETAHLSGQNPILRGHSPWGVVKNVISPNRSPYSKEPVVLTVSNADLVAALTDVLNVAPGVGWGTKAAKLTSAGLTKASKLPAKVKGLKSGSDEVSELAVRPPSKRRAQYESELFHKDELAASIDKPINSSEVNDLHKLMNSPDPADMEQGRMLIFSYLEKSQDILDPVLDKYTRHAAKPFTKEKIAEILKKSINDPEVTKKFNELNPVPDLPTIAREAVGQHGFKITDEAVKAGSDGSKRFTVSNEGSTARAIVFPPDENGKVIGSIVNFETNPELRRQGFGKALVKDTAEELRKRGATSFEVYAEPIAWNKVTKSREQGFSPQLFDTLGFEKTGRKNDFGDLEMVRDLTRAADEPTTPAIGGVTRPPTHFPDDATVTLTKSQRDDIAGSLKDAADDLLTEPNPRLVRTDSSNFNEFVRSLLDEHGQIVIPKKITGVQLGQYRKLAQEFLDFSDESVSKQKRRSMEGLIKKINDLGIDPSAANEALIRERGLDVKELLGDRATRIDRPARATAARYTAQTDLAVENAPTRIAREAEEAEARAAFQNRKTTAEEIEASKAARNKADQEAIIPRPIRDLASTIGRVTANEAHKVFDFAKFIAKIPIHPKKQAEEFYTIIANEKVILTGDGPVDNFIQTLSHAKDQSLIKTQMLKKERERMAAQMASLNDELLEAADNLDLSAFEHARRRMGSARKILGQLPTSLGIPEELNKIIPDSADDWSLQLRIADSKLSPFDKTSALYSYMDLMQGHMITKSEIENLSDVFGPGFRNAMNRFRGRKEAYSRIMVDILGIPVSFQGSYDMSAPLRQGFFLFTRMPANGVRTMGHMIKAFGSPTHAIGVEAAILSDPLYYKFHEAGLYHAKLSDAAVGKLEGRLDEVFISSLPSKIPIFGVGVRASQRAYTTFLNKMRFDYMKSMYKTWAEPVNVNGKMVKPTIPKKQLEMLATMANYATGRGPSVGPGWLRDVSSIAFYAPRLATSRFALPAKGLQTIFAPRKLGGGARISPSESRLAKQVQEGVEGASEKMSDSEAAGFLRANKQIRMENARLLTQGFGAMLAIIGGVKTYSNMTGGKVEVELDPRSTDFAKMKIGPVRVDNLAGMQQVFRVMAQLFTSQGKTSGSGSIVDKDAGEIIGRYLRAKFSPSTGLLWDSFSGETFIGEGVYGETEFDEETGEYVFKKDIGNLLWQRLGPLFLQDLVESMEEAGMVQGAFLAAPGFFGTSTTAYSSSREIVNKRLKSDIVVHNKDGDRIYDMRDLDIAQHRQVMKDRGITTEMQEMHHRGREDFLLSLSEQRDSQQLANDERLIRGKDYTGEDWRSDRTSLSIVGANVANVVQAIRGTEFEQDQKYGGLVGMVIESMGGANNPDRTPEEQALFDWYALMNQHIRDPRKHNSLDLDVKNISDAELKVISDSIDLDNLQPARDKFLAGLTESQLDYVITNTKPNRTGVEDTYLRGQRMMEEYWNVPETIANSYSRNQAVILEDYERYIALPKSDKQRESEFLILNPHVLEFATEVDNQRRWMREDNRDIDDFLVTFYDSTAQNEQNKIETSYGYYGHKTRERVLAGADMRLDESLNLSGVQR